MRVAITSRIFEPEPSAASFRLAALAEAFADAGHGVDVLTVRTPGGTVAGDAARPYAVRRFPVLRDRSGYVRGYLQYLSFDVPLFFRVLLGRRRDLIVVEAPPTTGFFVRVAAWIRRTPYAYYAADIWADATRQTGAHPLVIAAVKGVERFAWRGARCLISVSAEVTERLEALEPNCSAITVGNGVDVARFQRGIENTTSEPDPLDWGFVYAGTASEWHGAEILLEAYAGVGERLSTIPMTFIGGGADRARLEERARSLGVADRVRFADAMPAEELGPILAGCVAALATLRPGVGYDFAFPTKLCSAAACGAPLLHVGPGPAVAFVETEVAGESLGQAVPYDGEAVRNALVHLAQDFEERGLRTDRRAAVRSWAGEHVSLASVAEKAVRLLTERREP